MATANILARRDPSFSLDSEMLQRLLVHAKPMGHGERPADLNLGFGFVYYGLVRALRPNHVLVIGSGFGFSVACLGLGIKDNGLGQLTFVDPSYSVAQNGPLNTIGGANFWNRPDKVRDHFARFGLENVVTHFKFTSEEFFSRYPVLGLPKIDLAFIDGNHSYRHVQQDMVGTLKHGRKNMYCLLHDTNIYIREFLRHAGVKRWLRTQADKHKTAFEYVDFPLASGVALIRVLEPKVWQQLA